MLTTVLLYGALGAKFGREWKLAVHTPAEVIEAISCKFPNFKNEVLAMEDVDFGVTVGKEQIPGERLSFPSSGKTITITPVVRGSDDSKGWIQVIAGVVLVVAGLAIDYFTAGTGGNYLILLGISLALGGVAQLLTPSPTTASDTESKSKPSYQFGTIINTTGQGECVPVLYGGPMWVGSAVVSAAYENVDITQGSNATGGTSQTGINTGALPIISQHDNEG